MIRFLLLYLFPVCVFAQGGLEKIPQLFKDKQYNVAVQIATNYLAANPANLKAIEYLGDAFGHQKKWDKAIYQYKKLVDKKPNTANYHYKYGGALGMKALSISKIKALPLLGDLKEAFITAANLDPKHLPVRWALVELYMQLPGIIGGSKSKSLKYANQIEALSLTEGCLAKGYIYEYDNQPQKAEQYYKKAITISNTFICHNKLTTFYENQKDPVKTIQSIEQTQKIDQRNALHYQIGKVAAQYNLQLQKGERCLKNYITNYTPADGVPKAWAYYRLAQIYTHTHNKISALQYINLALEALPNKKPFKQQQQIILQL